MTTERWQSDDARRVKRLEQPLRAPDTRVEKRVFTALANEGSLSLDAVIDRVADELYRDELRHGGWAAEIGVIGSGAFRADVERVVERGAGVLWLIEPRPGVTP
jgi:hypothetical protein